MSDTNAPTEIEQAFNTIYLPTQQAWERHQREQLPPEEQPIMSGNDARSLLIQQFGFPVITDQSVQAIAKVTGTQTPVVEAGAGSGYLSFVLNQRGFTMIPTDICPWTESKWATKILGRTWIDSHRMTYKEATLLANQHQHNLLVSWPPETQDVEYIADHYQGPYLVHLGETDEARTGTRRFYETLDMDFDLVCRITIPTYHNVHDDITIWRRKSPTC